MNIQETVPCEESKLSSPAPKGEHPNVALQCLIALILTEFVPLLLHQLNLPLGLNDPQCAAEVAADY